MIDYKCDFFQTTKALHYDGYSMYTPIVTLFLQAVYHVAVTKDHFSIYQKITVTMLHYGCTVLHI